ncbi:MAG: hypothetical protein KA974_01460 [Saprospiraceae bacterium]|nr:hypothetical protein [Saprospiraceae bacterium]MBP7699424.1 hypothetical protein [Saprospiraceae bacterium]
MSSETNSTTTARYSDEDLAEFKQLIDSKLATARQELDFTREQIIELNENASDQQGADWFDDSSTHSELEMLNNQMVRQQQFIRNLENAMIRIQNKSYGICSVTGQLIEKKRLLLVPHATKSVSAKEEQSHQQLLTQQLIQQQMAAANRRNFDSLPGEDGELPNHQEATEEVVDKKEAKEKKQNKIITKIFKKSTKPSSGTSNKKVVDDDDDWDLTEYDDIDEENPDQMMGGMNMDDIADEDQMSSFL